jgi:hypothetical protein
MFKYDEKINSNYRKKLKYYLNTYKNQRTKFFFQIKENNLFLEDKKVDNLENYFKIKFEELVLRYFFFRKQRR